MWSAWSCVIPQLFALSTSRLVDWLSGWRFGLVDCLIEDGGGWWESTLWSLINAWRGTVIICGHTHTHLIFEDKPAPFHPNHHPCGGKNHHPCGEVFWNFPPPARSRLPGVKMLWSSWDIVCLQIQFSQSFIRLSQAVVGRGMYYTNNLSQLAQNHIKRKIIKMMYLQPKCSCGVHWLNWQKRIVWLNSGMSAILIDRLTK